MILCVMPGAGRNVNPFTVPACPISGAEKYMHMPANNVLCSPMTNPLSVLCALMKMLSYANRGTKKTERFRDFKFCTSVACYQVTSWP